LDSNLKRKYLTARSAEHYSKEVQMDETCKYSIPGKNICGKPITTSKFFAEGKGVDLCEDGHLVIWDPEIKDGMVCIWRFNK
jgi:hypothetical protein